MKTSLPAPQRSPQVASWTHSGTPTYSTPKDIGRHVSVTIVSFFLMIPTDAYLLCSSDFFVSSDVPVVHHDAEKSEDPEEAIKDRQNNTKQVGTFNSSWPNITVNRVSSSLELI